MNEEGRKRFLVTASSKKIQMSKVSKKGKDHKNMVHSERFLVRQCFLSVFRNSDTYGRTCRTPISHELHIILMRIDLSKGLKDVKEIYRGFWHQYRDQELDVFRTLS